MSDSPSLFRWQITIGKDLMIPFERGVYGIGIRAICLDLKNTDSVRPKIVHIFVNSPSTGARLWLDEKSCGFCLRTLVMGESGGLKSVFGGGDIEIHNLDLRSSYKLCISAVDEHGATLDVSGYCIIDAMFS